MYVDILQYGQYLYSQHHFHAIVLAKKMQMQ